MDSGFIAALYQVCSREGAAALVTVIQTRGSTPRKAGVKMLVLPEGQVVGTIGGGCGEAEVRREALDALTALQARRYTVNMTDAAAEEEGMICGGTMEVFIDVLRPGRGTDKALLLAYLEALKQGEQPTLITVVGSASLTLPRGARLFITAGGAEAGNLGSEAADRWAVQLLETMGPKPVLHQLVDMDGELFLEPSPLPVQLVVLGGGHIALPLVAMAKLLDYHITVMDDRPAFANGSRFPQADRVICADFRQALAELTLTPLTYLVIVTRGHRHDKVCLRQVVTQPAAYIGMIGSRRRVRILLDELKAEGILPEYLSRVHSPIGLAIGAETPAEIAVSILAEIVAARNGTKGQSLQLVKGSD